MKRFITLLLLVGVCLFASAQSITIHHKDGKFHLPTQKVDSISFNMKYMNSMDTTLLHKYITVNDTTVKTVVVRDTIWEKINVTDTIVNIVVLNDTVYNQVVLNDTVNFAGHDYVDLGLPSGTLWATCNVGADTPSESGLYFAFGETTGYTSDVSDGRAFDWSSYKWCNGTNDSLTKYCFRSCMGEVDNRMILDSSDDAASINWGGTWRIPTTYEFDELIEKCSWSWTNEEGVNGYKVTGPNGNFIFLPAAGYRDENRFFANDGRYRCRTIWACDFVDNFCFSEESFTYNIVGDDQRTDGLSVRPVTGSKKSKPICSFDEYNYVMKESQSDTHKLKTNSGGLVRYFSSDSGVAIVDEETGEVTTLNPGNVTITAYVDETNSYSIGSASYNIIVEEGISDVEHECVDLGLSVKWATCNVGADKPEDCGLYFAWGDTRGYAPHYYDDGHNFNWANYKWCKGNTSSFTKYCTKSSYGEIDNLAVLETSDDAATVRWGGSWRMPTKAEVEELVKKCSWIYTTQNDMKGYIVTGTNGNSIFLPGYSCRSTDQDVGPVGYGYYWTSSVYKDYPSDAYTLYFTPDNFCRSFRIRSEGLNIRPVCP